ncbi:two-component system response regulator NarL [Pantoea sp. Tr-811]|uniref:two-component system response regulator NarL n=1 Tax=unclassified Pantoea TaxID=2630326 RepID=UPI001424A5A4|nr:MULTISPECIES: two-component system response regulator NarL [unclassified Pantoea]NIE75279.1 two-component system response regulator NarL [Pantoea sp. Ap-967]NIF26351.1 two-component system response regulator NarL [Pantoea sp. Tr-811]
MTAAAPYTLLLADDHPMMRRAVRQLIELESDLVVVGEAGNGLEACAMAEQLLPDLLVLDNNMPQLNGVAALKRLRENGYAGPILLFTMSDAQQDVRDALRYGANGYLLKDMEPALLIGQLREVLAGGLVVSPSLASVLAQALRPPSPASSQELTERERQVLKMIAAGLSNKMIGNKLGITEGTVKVHVKHLLHKLGLRSRVVAAVWALENLR